MEIIQLGITQNPSSNVSSKKNETWIMDLTKGQEQWVSGDREHGKWLTAGDEIERGKGVLLLGRSDNEAPSLTFKLGVEGWHEIRFGIYYTFFNGGVQDRFVSVELSGDQSYTRIGREFFRTDKDGNFPEKETGDPGAVI